MKYEFTVTRDGQLHFIVLFPESDRTTALIRAHEFKRRWKRPNDELDMGAPTKWKFELREKESETWRQIKLYS